MVVCGVAKQQLSFVKFCIIIHALMVNSDTKFEILIICLLLATVN